MRTYLARREREHRKAVEIFCFDLDENVDK